MKNKSKILPPRDSQIRKELSNSAAYASTGFSSIYSGAKVQVTKLLSKLSNVCSSAVSILFPAPEISIQQRDLYTFSLKLDSISDTVSNPLPGPKPFHTDSFTMPPTPGRFDLLEEARIEKKTKVYKEQKLSEGKKPEYGIPLWVQLRSGKGEKANPNSTPITGKKLGGRTQVLNTEDRKCDSAKEEREKVLVPGLCNSEKSETRTPNFADIVEREQNNKKKDVKSDEGGRKEARNESEKEVKESEKGGELEREKEARKDCEKSRIEAEKLPKCFSFFVAEGEKKDFQMEEGFADCSSSEKSTPSKVSESDNKMVCKDPVEIKAPEKIFQVSIENNKKMNETNKQNIQEELNKDMVNKGTGPQTENDITKNKDKLIVNPFASVNPLKQQDIIFSNTLQGTDLTKTNPFKPISSFSVNPDLKSDSGLLNLNNSSDSVFPFAPKFSSTSSSKIELNLTNKNLPNLSDSGPVNPFKALENPEKKPLSQSSETKETQLKEPEKNPFLVTQNSSFIQSKPEQLSYSFSSASRPNIENPFNSNGFGQAVCSTKQDQLICQLNYQVVDKKNTSQGTQNERCSSSNDGTFSFGVIPNRTFVRGKRPGGK